MTLANLPPQKNRPLLRGPERQPFVNGTFTNTKSGRKLRPGEPGTKKLLARYGDDLFCVRYRYDSAGKRKLKTVELIVAETPWQPAAEKIPPQQMMRLWIPYDDLELQSEVQAARGKWNEQQQAWELAYREVIELGLTDYMME